MKCVKKTCHCQFVLASIDRKSSHSNKDHFEKMMEVQDTLLVPLIKMEGESGIKVNSLIMMNLGPKIQQKLCQLQTDKTEGRDQTMLKLQINASPEAVQGLVQLAYTGKVDIGKEPPNVREELLQLGVYYQVPGLVKIFGEDSWTN